MANKRRERHRTDLVVLDELECELTEHAGGDLTHALSAWTSTNRDLTEKKMGRIPGLLSFLASEEHGTPFEKSYLQFLVRTDIATHIHLLKHRIGTSINGESARYKEIKEDHVYAPTDWPQEVRDLYICKMQRAVDAYHDTLFDLVEGGVPLKRAKESARFHLPYGFMIKADVSFNFRSFAHFCYLRYSVHAQVEVRELAKRMMEQVWETQEYNDTMIAFGMFDKEGTISPPVGTMEPGAPPGAYHAVKLADGTFMADYGYRSEIPVLMTEEKAKRVCKRNPGAVAVEVRL